MSIQVGFVSIGIGTSFLYYKYPVRIIKFNAVLGDKRELTGDTKQWLKYKSGKLKMTEIPKTAQFTETTYEFRSKVM